MYCRIEDQEGGGSMIICPESPNQRAKYAARKTAIDKLRWLERMARKEA